MLQQIRIDEERGQERVSETCCCGCCTVKQGTIILGILGIVSSIISILDAIFDLGVSAGVQAGWKDQQAPTNAPFIRASEFVWAGIDLILLGFLFRGIATENANYVRRYLNWLYLNFGIFVLLVLLMGILMFIAELDKDGLFVALIALAIFGGLWYLILCLEWYFLNVVKRYMDELVVRDYSRPGGGVSTHTAQAAGGLIPITPYNTTITLPVAPSSLKNLYAGPDML